MLTCRRGCILETSCWVSCELIREFPIRCVPRQGRAQYIGPKYNCCEIKSNLIGKIIVRSEYKIPWVRGLGCSISRGRTGREGNGQAHLPPVGCSSPAKAHVARRRNGWQRNSRPVVADRKRRPSPGTRRGEWGGDEEEDDALALRWNMRSLGWIWKGRVERW